MKTQFTLATCIALITPCVLADIEIQMQDPEGTITTFWLGEHKVKMATQDTSGYVIVDVSKQMQFLIDHNEKMVIDVTEGLNDTLSPPADDPQSAPADKVQIKIEKVGDGPEIVGFKSDKYEVKADDTLCSVEYLSTEPFRHPEVVKLLEVMALLGESEDITNDALYKPCEQAELTLERQYQTYGIPLRSINADGVVTSEVVQFQVKDVPSSTYDFPPNYKLTSMRELLQEQIEDMAPPGAPPGHP